jgi:hypothetical protein
MPTLMELTIVLVVCPALLAAWADARYPTIRPTALRTTALHLGFTGLLSFVLLRPALAGIDMVLPGAPGKAAAVTVACVAITYCLVVTLWVMRSAAELARGSMR